MDGQKISESLSKTTNNEMSVDNPSEFIWTDYKELAVSDYDNDILLQFTFQTEQHGITKGRPIAIGQLNLKEVLHG